MQDESQPTIKVWDILVRIFHWSLVILFFTAYLSEGEPMTLHSWAGYGIGMLIVFRLVWGLIGTRYARFSNFVTRPATSAHYLKQALLGRAKRYIGHNPAGAAMILALLASLTLTIVTGMSLLATEGDGPLATTFLAGLPEDPLEEVHEFFANSTLFLVFIHVAGVLLASFQHRENLVRAMIHGYKAARTSEQNPSTVSDQAIHHSDIQRGDV